MAPAGNFGGPGAFLQPVEEEETYSENLLGGFPGSYGSPDSFRGNPQSGKGGSRNAEAALQGNSYENPLSFPSLASQFNPNPPGSSQFNPNPQRRGSNQLNSSPNLGFLRPGGMPFSSGSQNPSLQPSFNNPYQNPSGPGQLNPNSIRGLQGLGSGTGGRPLPGSGSGFNIPSFAALNSNNQGRSINIPSFSSSGLIENGPVSMGNGLSLDANLLAALKGNSDLAGLNLDELMGIPSTTTK